MNQTKLIRLLKAFRGKELAQLGQFLKSPLFNDGSRPQKVQALLEHLARFYPEFEGAELKKEAVFKGIFPEEKFSESKLDKVTSELFKATKKFIALCLCADEQVHEQAHGLALAQFYRQRGMRPEFHLAIEQLEKLQKETACQEQDYFFRQFALETERVRQLVRHNDRKTDINLPGAIQYLDIYYVISKMEYCSYLLTRGAHVNLHSPQSFTLLNEVLEMAKNHYLYVPVVAAYYHALLMLTRGEEEAIAAYQALKIVLEENVSQFSPGTLRLLQSYLRNHVAERYNRGESACLPELVESFKRHAQMGTLFQDDQNILASTLQSAVAAALKAGEHEWALDFLQKNRYRVVGADEPEAFYRLNLANCYFHQGNFQASEESLSGVNFRDIFYKLAARRLEVKLFFELNSPVFEARLEAFKIFVHELKKILSPDKIAPNNHFADLLRQIVAPQTLGNVKRIEKLQEKLRTQKAVAEREWLAEKLAAMLKNSRPHF